MYCPHGPEVGPMWVFFGHQVAIAAVLSKYRTYILQKQFILASKRSKHCFYFIKHLGNIYFIPLDSFGIYIISNFVEIVER